MNMKVSAYPFCTMLLALLLIVSGCAAGDSSSPAHSETPPANQSADPGVKEPPTRSVAHEMGTTPITGHPQRIVALEFSFVDALAVLGVSPVGIADDGNKDVIVEPIKSIIGSYTSVGTRKQPSLEIISSLKPDLIIADLNRHKEIYSDLQKIAPTLVLKSLESTYQENLDSFITIADALDRKSEGDTKLGEHKANIARMKSQAVNQASWKVLPAVVTPDLFNAHASKSYTGELLQLIGFENAIQQEAAYAAMNLEQLLHINPDVIFLMASGEKTIIDQWQSNPLWANLKAAQNNRIYLVNRDLWSKFRGLLAGEAIVGEAVQLLSGQ